MKKFPSGATVHQFEIIDSTSLEAKRCAEKGPAGPQWFLAQQQTAGYGRRSRAWVQAVGDFSGSLVFTPQSNFDRLEQISFVVALGVAAAVDEFVSPELVRLKWPNDILIEGGKAAGILLERIDGPDGPALIVGIGVNIVSAPADVGYKTARLVDHVGANPSPEELAARVDAHFWRYYKQWADNGFEEIRRDWCERAAGIGSEITVRLPNEQFSGVFEGIDDTGGLILRIEAEKRIISAGEVFFERPDASKNE